MNYIASPLPLPFVRLHPDARPPTRGRSQDAGLDLATVEAFDLFPGATHAASTGLAVAIPPGYCGLIVGRSGLGSKGLLIAGGLIDSSYRGEVKVILHNASDAGISFKAADRVGQMIILPVPAIEPCEAGELPASERGVNGFGSSGR